MLTRMVNDVNVLCLSFLQPDKLKRCALWVSGFSRLV